MSGNELLSSVFKDVLQLGTSLREWTIDPVFVCLCVGVCVCVRPALTAKDGPYRSLV